MREAQKVLCDLYVFFVLFVFSSFGLLILGWQIGREGISDV